jgi:thioredoxin 1
MRTRSVGNRKRKQSVWAWILAGVLPLSGCSWSKAVDTVLGTSGTPAKTAAARDAAPRDPASRPTGVAYAESSPADAATRARAAQDSRPTSPAPAGPPARDAAPSYASNLPSQPAGPPAWASGGAAVPIPAWSQPSQTPVRLASQETPVPAGPSPRGVQHVSTATFDEQVLRAGAPVLVDFSATWCGPCKRLAPTLNEVAAESPQVRVVKIDIDESPNLADRYGVHSVPQLMVFKNGQIVAQRKGLASKAEMKEMLGM